MYSITAIDAIGFDRPNTKFIFISSWSIGPLQDINKVIIDLSISLKRKIHITKRLWMNRNFIIN